MTDKTTDSATSHLTNPAKDAGQVIGYSHSTKLPAEELLAGHPKDSNQVAGYKLKLLVALIAGLTLSFPVAAKMYKWVDDNGTTHYGETIPPEYANKDRVELNQAGRVIKSDEVVTPERRRAKEQEDAKKRSDAKAELEQQRHDKTLINTYNSVKEINLARIRSLQQIDARINVINSYLKTASDNLLGLQKEADGYTNTNKKIPDSLQEDLQDAQARLAKLQQDLASPKAEKAALEARFDTDKARYIELTGKQ
jgi:Domain of unknown function (DUF4124)